MHPDEMRRAIDQIALLRARNVRVSYSAMALHRPDPTGATTQDDRDQYLKKLADDAKTMSNLSALLQFARPANDPPIPSDIGQWFHIIACGKPKKLARVVKICAMAQKLYEAAKNDSPSLGHLLNDYQIESRRDFFDLITELVGALWGTYGQYQRIDLEHATTTATKLVGRLERLEDIGRHVRLVSLNASVEAARAGDVGKGLMVIAQEFKGLAEEIQSLAQVAREDMNALSE
jgi:hypothetical protein